MLRLADNEAGLQAAAAAIRDGGLVAYPTDTLYGLGADARNPRAVAAALAAKGRGAVSVEALCAVVEVAHAVETGR